MESQTLKKKDGQVLNSFFVAILWIKLVFTSLNILLQTWDIYKDADGINPIMAIDIVLAIIAVCGAYLLLKVKKTGFYLIVFANIASAVLSYYVFTHISECIEYYSYSSNNLQYDMLNNIALQMAKETAYKGIWMSIGQIIFIMLLMLLKKDGKNAYQVLWGEEQPEVLSDTDEVA